MICLGLEAAGQSPGLGLADNNGVLWRMAEPNPPSRAQALFVYLDRAKREGRLDPNRLNLIAVTVGPGSFTGLKVGLAAAKGLAFSLDLPVAPVSSLAAIAWAVTDKYDSGLVCPVLDARRKMIYTALFRLTPDGPERLAPDQAADPVVWADRLRRDYSEPIIVSGEGLAAYQTLFGERLGPVGRIAPPELWAIDPGWVARLGLAKAAAGQARTARTIEANYIRPADAILPKRTLVRL